MTTVVDPGQHAVSESELAAERSALGGMLLSADTIAAVTAEITPEHFYRPAHQAIAQRVLDLDARGEPVDAVAVATELEHRGELERVGGAPYLHTLLADVPTAANAVYYATLVRAAADRRAARELGVRVVQAAEQNPEPDVLAQWVDTAYQDYARATSTNDDAALTAGDETHLDEVVAAWGTEPISALTTGISDVDRALHADLGALVVLAARSGVGKSILAAQMLRHYALDRHEPVVLFSAEMSATEIAQRDLAALAGIPLGTATGKVPMPPGGWDRLRAARDRYAATGDRYTVDAASSITVARIRSRLRELHRRHGHLGLVVVDYLQLMDRPGRQRDDLELGEITRQLKIMAGEFNTIIVLVAQLNRGPEQRTDGQPRASDLRGSGNIEQDANVVMLLHDVATYNEARGGEVDLLLDKQRGGKSHVTITLADQRHRASFRDLSGDTSP